MGWSLGPMCFTKFLRPVMRCLRDSTSRRLPPWFTLTALGDLVASLYLDDLLLAFRRHEDGSAIIAAVRQLYQALGLEVKLSKSVLQPM